MTSVVGRAVCTIGAFYMGKDADYLFNEEYSNVWGNISESQ